MPLVSPAAERLAVFECQERLERDWPRTLVTYQQEFPTGQLRNREIQLVDTAGREQPGQVWHIKKHADGSIASARISFLTELAKGTSYRFELFTGKTGAVLHPPTASTRDEVTTLDNGIVALRLPKMGEFKLDPPLAM